MVVLGVEDGCLIFRPVISQAKKAGRRVVIATLRQLVDGEIIRRMQIAILHPRAFSFCKILLS